MMLQLQTYKVFTLQCMGADENMQLPIAITKVTNYIYIVFCVGRSTTILFEVGSYRTVVGQL